MSLRVVTATIPDVDHAGRHVTAWQIEASGAPGGPWRVVQAASLLIPAVVDPEDGRVVEPAKFLGGEQTVAGRFADGEQFVRATFVRQGGSHFGGVSSTQAARMARDGDVTVIAGASGATRGAGFIR